MRNLLLATLLIPFTLFAQPSQFRGENRDGKYPDQGLLKVWPEGGPERIFTVEGIGKGHSSAVVAGDLIYITGMKESRDYLSAIGFDGEIKWQVTYGDSWAKSFPDTRSTPTVDGNRVYVRSGSGQIACIDALTGKEIWKANTDQDFESQWHKWGVAESILIVDNLAVCTPAGSKASVVAYDKFTGKVVWQTPPVDGQQSYASAVIFNWKGFRYILTSTTTELLAIVPETGVVAWSFRHWQADRDANGDSGHIYTNNPVIRDNGIFLTRGYNYPCLKIELGDDGKTITEKWTSPVLDNHHHAVIETGGYLYGSNWLSNAMGNWVCLDWKTGEVRWEQPWFNKGPVIFADGMLYIQEEKTGNFGLVRPDPEKFDLVSSFKIDKGTGPFWAHPTICDGKLFIRHGDVLMVHRIK